MPYVGAQPIPRASRVLYETELAQDQSVVEVPGGYSVGNIEVFVNGVVLHQVDYTAIDGSTISFGSPAFPQGTAIRVMEIRNFEMANHYTKEESIALSGALPETISLSDGETRNVTIDDSGKMFQASIDTTATINLPIADAFQSGAVIAVRVRGGFNESTGTYSGGQVTVNGPEPLSLYTLTGGANSTFETITLGPGVAIFRASGLDGRSWILEEGDHSLTWSPQFTHEFISSVDGGGGYQLLPSGFIIQWGNMSIPDDTNTTGMETITFTIPFPNRFDQVLCTDRSLQAHMTTYGIHAPSNTGCSISWARVAGTQSNGCYWFAIGH